MHFHAPNSTTLFDFIPRDVVPKEYGGTLDQSVKQIKEGWLKKINANREFFTDDSKWAVDEAKRPIGSGNKTTEMQGSFRSLSID